MRIECANKSCQSDSLFRGFFVLIATLVQNATPQTAAALGVRPKLSKENIDPMSNHNEVLVITTESTIQGTHRGTVEVRRGGKLNLHGVLQGTLALHTGATAHITGQQQGTVAIASGASVVVLGSIQGTTSLKHGASLVIEPTGKLAGTLANYGVVVVRGVFGGAQSGNGTLRLEEDGYIKQPTSTKDGVHYYEW